VGIGGGGEVSGVATTGGRFEGVAK